MCLRRVQSFLIFEFEIKDNLSLIWFDLIWIDLRIVNLLVHNQILIGQILGFKNLIDRDYVIIWN